MEFVTKKTTELSEEERSQLVELFNEVFERNSSVDQFTSNYTSNYLGYSFHTLVKQDGKIVGSNSMVPIKYNINGVILPFVNSGGTMISKSCRGIENFYDMIKESYKNAEDNGFKAVMGYPNDNSYPLFKGIRMMKDIGKMHTYILPFRIGGIKKGFRIFNPLSKLFSSLWLFCSGCLASRDVPIFKNAKDLESFESYRYKGDEYKRIDLGKSVAHYATLEYEGIRTAFLIDVTQKSASNFCKATKEIWKKEKENVDLILYVGNLPFKNHGFIEVPRKYEPKNFNFTGYILDDSIIKKEIFFDFSNWDVNLSNYDLI